MACARCGDEADDPSRGYDYCEDCRDLFNTVQEDGVFCMRHSNRTGGGRHAYVVNHPGGSRVCDSQTEGLANAVDLMDRHDCRGVFAFPPNGSRWLVDEYLSAHPGIASDVRSYRKKHIAADDGGLIDRVAAVLTR